jgi:hypothetical protein
MSYNGSGTFQINSAGQPVVTGTVISSTAFNALTADLATGLSTAITKDGQTATTVRVPFAAGISSTLTTDATSATTGSIITAGGISTQKALWVGTTANVVGTMSAFQLTVTASGQTAGNTVTNIVGNTNADNKNLIEFAVGQYQKTTAIFRNSGCAVSDTATQLVFQYATNTQSGTLTSTGATVSLNSTSDSRVKTDIAPLDIEHSKAVLNAYAPSSFVINGAYGIGAVAQNTYYDFKALGVDAGAIGLVVMGDDDPSKKPGDDGWKMWAMDNSKMVPWMAAVMKAQMAEIDDLKSRISALEGKL